MKNINRIKAALDKAYPSNKDKAAHFNVRTHDVCKKIDTIENKLKWVETFIKPLGLSLKIKSKTPSKSTLGNDKFKGTKGEWFLSGGTTLVSMPSQTKIANRISGNNYEEAKANARLMESAPNLLKAATDVINGFNNGTDKDVMTPLQDAINKAL